MLGENASAAGHEPAPVICMLLAASTALSSAPVGGNATPPVWPRGYQPWMKYCRASAARPAASGLAKLVPPNPVAPPFTGVGAPSELDVPPGATVEKNVETSGFRRPSVVGPRDTPPTASRLFHAEAAPPLPTLFDVAGVPAG